MSDNQREKISLSAWLSENLIDIAVVLICIGYVGLGLLQVISTGKEPFEIVFDGAKALIVGLVISRLLKMKGVVAGERTVQFLNTKKAYGDIIDKATPFIDKIQKECDVLNAEKIRLLQTRILLRVGLSYDKFIAGELPGNLTKDQKKAVKRATNVKIKFLDTDFLLCDANDEEGGSYGRNKKEWMRFTDVGDVLSKVLFAIIGGMYSVELMQGVEVASLIWEAFQVVVFLGLGTMNYFKSYSFINDEYRTLIIQKTNILTEIYVKLQREYLQSAETMVKS